MEDSWGNWISQLEMGDDDFFNQSSDNSFDEHKFLREMLQEEPDLSPEFESAPSPNLHLSEAVVEGGAHSPTGNNNNNNNNNNNSSSSNSLISLQKPPTTASSQIPTCINLTFDDNSSPPSSPLGLTEPCTKTHGLKRRFIMENINIEDEFEEERVKRARKKVGRTSSETKNHIMAERKRRQEVTESIIALAATIPGLKKMDKAHVLREAVNHVKQLQERVKGLENENKDRKPDSVVSTLKSQGSSNESTSNISETNSISGYRSNEALLAIEARVLEKEVLIGIHCEKQKDVVLKILILLKKIHLSVARASVLPFGTSTLVINIIVQMDDEYTMTMDELVNRLRQDMLKSRDTQQLLEY